MPDLPSFPVDDQPLVLPMDDEAFARDLSELVSRVNGFVYAGHRVDAVVDTVGALRADPDLALRLLVCGSSRRQAEEAT